MLVYQIVCPPLNPMENHHFPMVFHSYVKLPEVKPPFSHGFLWFSYDIPIVVPWFFLWFSTVFLWFTIQITRGTPISTSRWHLHAARDLRVDGADPAGGVQRHRRQRQGVEPRGPGGAGDQRRSAGPRLLGSWMKNIWLQSTITYKICDSICYIYI